jgi:tRNA-2-methylthio-N6-dimethylallyladenosine synthase
VREQIPQAGVTTDVIVGFPTETEADFQATLDVVREARFAAAFTFQYSIRPGTPAGEMADQVPHEIVQERYVRLVELIDQIAWEENKKLLGTEVEVMFATGEGRKDERTNRMSGRARDNRLIHVAIPQGAHRPRPGDIASATVTYAADHHLLADSGFSNLIRTAGGDAWAKQSAQADIVTQDQPV